MKKYGFGMSFVTVALMACAHDPAPVAENIQEPMTINQAQEKSIREEKLAILAEASNVNNAKAEHVAVLPGNKPAKVEVTEHAVAAVQPLRLPSYDRPMPPSFEMTKKAPALKSNQGPQLNPNFEKAGTIATPATYFVNVEALNVRFGPAMDQAVIKVIRMGDQVKVLAARHGWAQIGENEFVASKFLDAEAPNKQGTLNVKTEKEKNTTPAVAPTIDI